VSALTHATLVDICRFPPTRALAGAMMAEAQAVGEKLGLRVRISIERRIAGAEAVGAHKTSTLQDVESGRPLELEILVGSVAELARLTETPTPAIDAIYACASLLAHTLGSDGRLVIQRR
jgi:2-dehydropantoate 2-reductase